MSDKQSTNDSDSLKEARQKRKDRLSKKRKLLEARSRNLPCKKPTLDNNEAATNENKDENHHRRIVDYYLLIDQLRNGCSKCGISLSLLNADLKNITHPNKIKVLCMECQTKSALTIHCKEVEEQLLLGCLHAGIGRKSFGCNVSIPGLGCMACGSFNFKKIERSVGPAIEETASESCEKWEKGRKENRGRKFWK